MYSLRVGPSPTPTLNFECVPVIQGLYENVHEFQMWMFLGFDKIKQPAVILSLGIHQSWIERRIPTHVE
jgi:hypothetical protein